MRSTDLEILFKEASKAIGLGNFESEIYQSAFDLEYTIILKRKFKLDFLEASEPKKLFDKHVLPIIEDVRNSEIVKSELHDLQKSLSEAEARIKELEPYEQYYKLALKMEHGNERS